MTTLTPTQPGKTGRLDLDLIRKYSVPGPRYTSYPPATKFTPELSALGLGEAIADDNGFADRPISLYFHLPFCETRCWFCGCNTVITKRRGASAEYLIDLEREMRLTAARIDRNRPVVQIHLGGGTPTFFRPDELRKLGALIRELFPNRAPQCEFGVEIDPRRIDQDHVQALREMGANRASLGVQDTNPRVQLAIHRIQPKAKNEQAFAWLREEGFASINVDLIYGLPLQTEESFAQTIDDVLALGPDRLSVFSYAHVPWIKPAQKIFDDRAQLPDADQKLAMFAVAHEKLTAAGFVDIGLDHFARPDDELAKALRARTLHRNFQGYSTQSGASLYGFGVSSISSTPDTYRQNFKTLAEWREALEKGHLPVERGLRLTAEDQRRRHVIMKIMCERELDFASLSRELSVDRPDQGFIVNPEGVPRLRVIAMAFDQATLPTSGVHSRTI
jgi:oxygen-independent coproporphyrinogen-3 oxidase